MIYEPKESLVRLPSLWLPSPRRRPLSYPASSRGMPGYPCCIVSACENCADGFDTFSEITVKLPVIVNKDCLDCAAFSEAEVVATVVPGVPCRFTHIFTGACNGPGLTVAITGPASFRVTVRLTFGFFPDLIGWEKNYGGSPPNCTSFLNESIPDEGFAIDTCQSAAGGPVLLTV